MYISTVDKPEIQKLKGIFSEMNGRIQKQNQQKYYVRHKIK
jgi:hypothetical protein